MLPLAEQFWEIHPGRIHWHSSDQITFLSPAQSLRHQAPNSPDPYNSSPRDPAWSGCEPPHGEDRLSKSSLPETARQYDRPGSPSLLLVRQETPLAWDVLSPAPSTKGSHTFTEKSFVVPHQHMGLNLLGSIETDTDHDQQRGAAEIERHIQLIDQ